MMDKTFALLISAGVMLVIVGLILSIGSEINQEVKDNSNDKSTASHINESVSITAYGNTLACSGNADSPADITVTSVYNGTPGGLEAICEPGGIPATCASGTNVSISNYTLTALTGFINFTTGTASDGSGHEAVGSNFTVTYTCSNYGLIWAIGLNSTIALNELVSWNSTIATVIAAVVIITMLLSGFGAWLYFKR